MDQAAKRNDARKILEETVEGFTQTSAALYLLGASSF
jgi:hypothetical protein